MQRLDAARRKLYCAAVSTAQENEFPECLKEMHLEGYYQEWLKEEVQAVLEAEAEEKTKRGEKECKVHSPRQVSERTFLERCAHDSNQLKKMIKAMLTSVEACGESHFLRVNRPKILRFFDEKTLPDPTNLGFNVLGKDALVDRFGDLKSYYQQISEKHRGEVISLVTSDVVGKDGRVKVVRHPNVPEVHNIQFYGDDALNNDWLKYAAAMFKDKWWRDPESGSEGYVNTYISNMRSTPNTVWQPTEESDCWEAQSRMITWHTLDSLVWELALKELPEIHFGEVYLFFNTCKILAYKRLHSTQSEGAKKKHAEKFKKWPRWERNKAKG